LSQGQPEIIIIGTGTNGTAYVAPETGSWAKGKNISLMIQPSYEAIANLNELASKREKLLPLFT